MPPSTIDILSRGDEDRWLAAARETEWTPAAYACYDFPWIEAARQLRISPATFRAVLDDGMPCAAGPDGELFVDAHDVFNLALDTGWRRALPVIGFRSAMRWLAGDPADLVRPRSWNFAIGGSEPPEAAELWISAPDPERHGGCFEDADRRAARPGADGTRRVRIAAGESLRGRAHVVGHRRTIVSSVIRDATEEVTGSGRRWAKLPLKLQRYPDEVERLGYATCVSTTLALAGRLRREGFELTTRRGWLMGTLPAAHSWIEVRDEDGHLKAVDPVLVLLRRRLDELESASAATRPVRAGPPGDLADGLLAHRVLSTAAQAHDDLAVDSAGEARFVAGRFNQTDWSEA